VVLDGRYGPYVTDGETNATLHRDDDVETIAPERGFELLAEKRAKSPAKKAARKAPARKAPAKTATATTATAKKTAATKTATKTAAKKAPAKKAPAKISAAAGKVATQPAQAKRAGADPIR
jgi:DNA topoisomerase-1